MSDIHVRFPKPCSENWDDMMPTGCNRHCASCEKTIYDLSEMTSEEAEALLDNGEEVCVRAAIQADGTVSFVEPEGKQSRRMIALVGVSLSLATAACQTAPFGQVSPRFEISGEVGTDIWASKALLERKDGRSWSTRIDRDRRFSISNLQPGVYALSFTGMCGEVHRFENIIVRDNDLDTGKLSAQVEEDCVIIGVFERVETGGRG